LGPYSIGGLSRLPKARAAHAVLLSAFVCWSQFPPCLLEAELGGSVRNYLSNRLFRKLRTSSSFFVLWTKFVLDEDFFIWQRFLEPAKVRSEPRCRCRDGEEFRLMRTGDSREYRLSGGLQVRVSADENEMNIYSHQNDAVFFFLSWKNFISKLMYKMMLLLYIFFNQI
jgi:hypothetical protein